MTPVACDSACQQSSWALYLDIVTFAKLNILTYKFKCYWSFIVLIALSVNLTLFVFQTGIKFDILVFQTSITKMASQCPEDMFSEIDCILTCSNCLQYYKDSRLLPCSHVYCTACLDQIFSQSAHPGELSCPSCQFEVPLTNGRVTSLPNDPLVASMVEAVSQLKHLDLKQSPECSLCVSANVKVSSEVLCVECMNTLCIQRHSRLLDTHTELVSCNDIQMVPS